MVSGATIVALAGQPKGVSIRYACADGNAIAKGDLLILSGANTAAPSTDSDGEGKPFVGIASTEKKADDGSTSIGAWTKGKFDIFASGAIDAGAYCMLSGANHVAKVDAGSAAVSGAALYVGKCLEAGTDLTAGVVAIGIY